MIPAPDGFPPFDESWRPTVNREGRQLSEDTFARWFMPAVWLDERGAFHFDIPAWHRWLGWPMNAASIRRTGQMMRAMLEEQALGDKSGREWVIIAYNHPMP